MIFFLQCIDSLFRLLKTPFVLFGINMSFFDIGISFMLLGIIFYVIKKITD